MELLYNLETRQAVQNLTKRAAFCHQAALN